MNPEKLRDYLERLSRKELESLSTEALGNRNASAKNKEAIIAALMNDAPRVVKALGGDVKRKERSSTHLYGLIGVIGTVLTCFAFFSQSRDTTKSSLVDPLREQQVLDSVKRIRASKPTFMTEESNSRQSVDTVPEPTTTGFELLEHSVICDLRKFRPVSSVDHDKKLSPVVQSIHQRIKKIDGSQSYLLAAHTSGIDVFCQSASHPLIVHASEERRSVAEKYTVKPRVLEFDVSEEAMNSEFTIKTTKTFWNAFNNPDQSWVGIIVGLPTRSISYLVVFPENKPYTSFKLFVDDEHQNRRDLPTEHYVLEDPHKRWLWWNIVDPKPRHSYNIDWEW